ncbi:polysaccharide biosynthesis protein [Halovivax asiaticus JCM 14624]|uniref:Polysaccharide biosynthesis protein n=1 Tax=Halovivax asiaticus JCM 14624 TaxID=1227490 RepID=M0BMY5_9EURY|nr:flippase [Halovivax asiaticus]ELZ11653.1 polysaccharide biosynthesis protein [Halovivax asiaticus JCM 14624]
MTALSADILRGVKVSFYSRAVHTLTNGLLVVLLAGTLLGPDEYGLLFLVLSIVGVAQLFADLGIARAAARYVSEYKETDDGQVPYIVASSLRYRLVLIAVVCIAILLGRQPLAAVLDEPALIGTLVVGAAFLAFQSIKVYHVTLFQGFNRLEYSALVSIVDNVGRFVFVVAFVFLGGGVLGALAGYVLGSVLATAVGLFVLFAHVYRSYDRADRPEHGLRRRILEYSIPLTASRSANVIDRRVDIILVGFFLNPAAVGFYTLGKQISEFVEAPAGAVGFALSPVYGEEKAAGGIDRASRLYESSMRYVLLLYVPAVAGVIVVAEPGIRLVFGDAYEPAIPVLQVLSLFVLFKAINSVTTQALDYLGRARHRAIVKGVTSAGNFGLNVVLIPVMGVTGAALATVLTFGVYSLANVYIMHRELTVRWTRLARVGTIATAIALVMGGLVLTLSPHVTSILSLAAVVTVGVAVWAFLATVTGLLDIERVSAVVT